MRVLDLFSGIGAYALGAERAGAKIAAFCEVEDFPRRILRKHWPDVPIYEDVRTLTADVLRRDGIAVDVILGGWPCQDISPAGTRSGLDGARSGLWSEVARLAGELRPDLLVLENSSNLLGSSPDGEPSGRDFGRVLGDLAALGYDAEWHCLSAAAFDAPHIRDRIWIVAHRRGTFADAAWSTEPEQQAAPGPERKRARAGSESARTHVADTAGDGRYARRTRDAAQEPRGRQFDRGGEHVALANADCARLEKRESRAGDCRSSRQTKKLAAVERSVFAPYPHGFPSFGASIARRERHSWEPEPELGRVVHGVADRVDRIHALGNCNPPIIVETIFRAIIKAQEHAA